VTAAAATVTGLAWPPDWALIIVLVLVLVLGWLVSLLIWPFGPCPRCGGTGKNRGTVQRRDSRALHRLVLSPAPCCAR